MSFTITCVKCGQVQKLQKGDYYDKDKISLEVTRFSEPYEAVDITCKNCGNYV